jgi:hypothetical protein
VVPLVVVAVLGVVQRLGQIPDLMSGICEMILAIAPFLFGLDVIPDGGDDRPIKMPGRIVLVVFIDLREDHFRCYDGSAEIVDKVVVALLVAQFELGHIRAGGIEPFLVAGNLGDCQVGLVEPGMGSGGIYGQHKG